MKGPALCSYLTTSFPLVVARMAIFDLTCKVIKLKQPEGQLSQWTEQLHEYNFTIILRPGRKHGNNDATLSRQPCQQHGRIDHSTSAIIAHVTDKVLYEVTEAQIQALQLDDPSIGMVLRAKESNDKPTSEHA